MARATSRRRTSWPGLLPAGLALTLVTPGCTRKNEAPSARATAIADPAPRAAGSPGSPAVECAGPPPPVADARLEARIVELVNERRAAAGLPSLDRSEELTGSARWFARSMATQDYFLEDHDTYAREGERLQRVCDWDARIGHFYPRWTALGETIAAGPATAEEVVEGWMKSPVHRADILGAHTSETGAGYWRGGSREHYWVLDLGRRATTSNP